MVVGEVFVARAFLAAEALAAKALPERAMRSLYQPVYPGVYVPWGIELTARQRAEAAWPRPCWAPNG